jgi:formylglycine-generating enzyme required for sulfatase activity
VYFAAEAAAAVPAPPVPQVPMQPSRTEVAQFCQAVATNPSRAVLQSLLEASKGTPMAACVEARLGELKQAESANQAAEAKKAETLPGHVFRDCADCPEMVVVPKGRFTMGGLDGEEVIWLQGSDRPRRQVSIGYVLAVGRYAITVEQFEKFVQTTKRVVPEGCQAWPDRFDVNLSFRNPGFAQAGDHPVGCVSWDEAKAFAAWVSEKTGKRYRLLSEAEREYVTRAGTTTAFWWGDTISPAQANYWAEQSYKGGPTGTFRNHTVPVNAFQENPWKLFQVHGNVAEWVEDCWHPTYKNAPSDGSAWTDRDGGDCTKRVVRTGSYINAPSLLRSGQRIYGHQGDRHQANGFRVALTLD